MVDLDTMLREALTDDAKRAPELPERWTGPVVAVTAPSAPSPSWHRRGAIWLGAAVAATVGVLVIADLGGAPHGDVDSAVTAAWTPPGAEFLLEDLGVPESNPFGITIAGMSRALGVEGHPPLVTATSLHYAGGATAELQRCLSQNGSAGCYSPESRRHRVSVGITSSVDNGVADYDLWTWDNVPSDAVYVTYTDGSQVRWQRPLAGVVAFPNVPGDDEVVIAYNRRGTELARVDRATIAAENRRYERGALADISRTQYEQLSTLTDTTFVSCLTDHGARIGTNVAVLPTGVDELAVWNQCVARVKQVVGDRIDSMRVTFFDPGTERPTSPDPAFNVGEPGD
jgi:hypothetical protein